jgi:uncharacterized delta-60 repeat protein
MKSHSPRRILATFIAVAATAAITWSLLLPSAPLASHETAPALKPVPPASAPGATAATPPLTLPVAENVPENPAAEPVIVSTAATVIGSQWQSPSQAECLAFSHWARRYLAAPVAERKTMLAEGIATATARRVVLAKMIRENPEQALAAAVPMMVRRDLPAEVTAQIEERVSGKGSVNLLAGTPVLGSKNVVLKTRHALVGRSEYEAFSYGRRAKLSYLPEVSVLGIALDGMLAVSDSPIRMLEAGETADGKTVAEVCLISGAATPVQPGGPLNTRETTALETNGMIQMVCKPAHISKLEVRLIAGEGLQANGLPGSSSVLGKPAYAWTHGPKKVLIIRVDFSDFPGPPTNNDGTVVTPQYAVDLINAPNQGKDLYEQSSYGQTSLVMGPVVAGVSPDVTAVLRMPATGSSYALAPPAGTGASNLLHSDARTLATDAGYNLANYDRIGVVFTSLSRIVGSNLTYGGLASLQGKEFWSNGNTNFGNISHEIGHSYGLNHASSWAVTDGNPVSPNGNRGEYGDQTDVMGNGEDITTQFSHWNRSIAQWLPDAAVTTISSGGTYRVHRFDSISANLTNPLALKIVRNRTQDYWIGFRRATSRAEYNNGAYILWGANQNTNGLLLDMNTPGNSVADAPLAVGQTFNDTASGITLTTVVKGGSGADEYLDVQVGFQPRIAWTSSSYNADESSSSATLVLSRSNNSTGAVSVHYATAPGTATSPADFTASSGDVTWANGDAADKSITIPLVADTIAEGSENFTVTLSNVSGGVMVDDPSTMVSIVDPGGNDLGFAASFINSSVNKTLIQPDGSVLITGAFSLLSDAAYTNYTRLGIARMAADGSVDTSFSTAGGAGAINEIKDIARQPDGKILVAGSFTTMNGGARNCLARLNSDGSLDTAFNPGTGADDQINTVLVQPNGKVLIGGQFLNFNGTAREYLARLNADGSLDTSFTGPDFGETTGWRVNSLALQPDGKLIVAGSFYFSGGAKFKASICRVTTTGSLDDTFNGVVDGAAVVGNASSIREISTIAVQLDGHILIGGSFTAYNNVSRSSLARLTATGAIDPTFTPTLNGSCKSLLIQPDGKIVVGGTFTTFNGTSVSNLVRISGAGLVDSGFSAAGGPDVAVNTLAMQADGKIVLGTDYGSFQTKTGPLFRMFGGLSGLPGTIQLASASASVTEGNSSVLTVTRTGGSAGALSVNYSTVIGTAGAADFTTVSNTLSWANGDATAKTITITITTDALTEGLETFTVNLGQPLLGGAILGATQSTTISISDPGAITAYQTWREAKFTPGELANDSISGNLSDPDNDSIVNLLEYAQGLAPKTSSQVGPPIVGKQIISGSTYLTLTFRRRITAPDLTYTAQINGTLPGNWSGGSVIVGSPISNGDGTETVTYRDTVAQTAANQRFMRLQVTLAL